MSQRLRNLRHIMALQKTLADRAGWQLVAAERHKGAVDADRATLATYVATAQPSGAFASLAVRTMSRLAARQTTADLRAAEAVEAKRQAESRLRLAERLVEACDAQERDVDERRRLEELTEVMLTAAQTGRADR